MRQFDGSIGEVVMFSGQIPIAAIEVLVNNAVGDEKTVSLPIPFIVINGNEVFENPSVLRPIQDFFKQYACIACKSALSAYLEEDKKIANFTGLVLPTAF